MHGIAKHVLDQRLEGYQTTILDVADRHLMLTKVDEIQSESSGKLTRVDRTVAERAIRIRLEEEKKREKEKEGEGRANIDWKR